jgi:hypothetical protein
MLSDGGGGGASCVDGCGDKLSGSKLYITTEIENSNCLLLLFESSVLLLELPATSTLSTIPVLWINREKKTKKKRSISVESL